MSLDTLKQQFTKPLISAGVGSIILVQLFKDRNFYIRGRKYSMTQLGLLLGFSSSFIGEFVNGWILPYAEKNPQLRTFESMAMSFGVAGAIFAVIPKMLVPELEVGELRDLMLAGGATEIVSSYIYSNIVRGVLDY